MKPEDCIFWDHRDRLALYAKLKDKVKDKERLYERLVVRPTRKMEWKQNSDRLMKKGDV